MYTFQKGEACLASPFFPSSRRVRQVWPFCNSYDRSPDVKSKNVENVERNEHGLISTISWHVFSVFFVPPMCPLCLDPVNTKTQIYFTKFTKSPAPRQSRLSRQLMNLSSNSESLVNLVNWYFPRWRSMHNRGCRQREVVTLVWMVSSLTSLVSRDHRWQDEVWIWSYQLSAISCQLFRNIFSKGRMLRNSG